MGFMNELSLIRSSQVNSLHCALSIVECDSVYSVLLVPGGVSDSIFKIIAGMFENAGFHGGP